MYWGLLHSRALLNCMLKRLTLGDPHGVRNVFIDLIPHLAAVSLRKYTRKREIVLKSRGMSRVRRVTLWDTH